MVQWDYAELLHEKWTIRWERVGRRGKEKDIEYQDYIKAGYICTGKYTSKVPEWDWAEEYLERVRIVYHLSSTEANRASEICKSVSQGLVHLGRAGFEMVGFLENCSVYARYLFKRPVE